MPSKFAIFWYRKSPFAKNAFLYNCRDDDLAPQPGSRIERGEIVFGAVGLVVAEQIVPGLIGKVIRFHSNRRCEWQGCELPCMVHPNVTAGLTAKTELRGFNYAVAELTNIDAVALATNLKLPVIQDVKGRKLINVELASFQSIGKHRRAKLI